MVTDHSCTKSMSQSKQKPHWTSLLKEQETPLKLTPTVSHWINNKGELKRQRRLISMG